MHRCRMALERPYPLTALRSPELGTCALRSNQHQGAVRGKDSMHDVIANLKRARNFASGCIPEDHQPVVRAGHHQASIPRERRRVHGAAVAAFEGPQDLPCLGVPQPCAAIVRRSQGQLSVWREDSHPQVSRVALQRDQELSRIGVPHLRGRVVRCCDYPSARRPHDEGDLGAVGDTAVCQASPGGEHRRAMKEPLPWPRNAEIVLDALPELPHRSSGWQRGPERLLPPHCDHR
mmetsp:Transcript_10822/g.32597  ORF Transcript_10822/g.32597 Transcript_10822/m.32597 type:complete len:234 (-) Transcript_10822:129-830(-)